jgi:hypothetical protein
VAKDSLAKNKMTLEHPPHSPDLAPAELPFWLFEISIEMTVLV